ncbi:MAG: serine/threonine protein kinase [Cyanobacterium sp.]
MTDYTNFEERGYQIVEKLTDNIQGGRVTYKAIEIETQTPVIIKQFRFANSSNWDSFKEIEREIDVLKGLKHRGIPQYLDKVDSGEGLCLVQEYKNAEPLSKLRSFTPEDIKHIITQILEILVYLQERIPSIIHRDLKPENILVDDDLNAYVIDFGLARIGSATMALSTMQGGTLGFMPPEQVHNQKLTEASDLYGLGATIICLITQTKSQDIGSLVNFATNRINFKDKASRYSFKFIQWLEKMVEPDPSSRYANAQLALEAFKPLYVVRVPEIRLYPSILEYEASKLGEKIQFTVELSNSVPDTELEGRFSIVDHPSDRTAPLRDRLLSPKQITGENIHNVHSWINVSQPAFKGNRIQCLVTVDTKDLRAGQLYQRQLELISNASENPDIIPISIKTAPIPVENKSIPYFWLSMLFAVSLFLPLQLVLMEEVFSNVGDRIESIWQ